MYIRFTKLILFSIGAAHSAIASSSSSSGTTTPDLVNSDADVTSSSNGNGNIGDRLLQGGPTCVCSPRTYTLKFNFDGGCPIFPPNGGVASASCAVGGLPAGSDFTPTRIISVTVTEYGPNNILCPIQSQTIRGPFFNGDTIQYTSISDTLDPSEPIGVGDNPSKIPGTIRLELFGENADGRSISNVNIVTYSLRCDVEPITSEGDQTGWVVMSNEEPAIPAFCGAVTAPTESPAPTVTVKPSEAPTESPTTAAPTVTPSEAPTESPTISEAPTESSTFNSMSYHSASFSVSHAKTAKAKAVKAGYSKKSTKGGKISKRN